jgi:HD-like signal output (HDOD) protein
LAQRLSPVSWRSGADTLFLTGLFHDLGKILFLAQEPDNYLEDLERAQSPVDLLLLEEARFGCDHAEAGGAVLGCWDFPPAIATVVRHHHVGGLRAEFRPDWDILQAVDGTLGDGLTEGTPLPEALLSDLTAYLEAGKAEARAIYQAIR